MKFRKHGFVFYFVFYNKQKNWKSPEISATTHKHTEKLLRFPHTKQQIKLFTAIFSFFFCFLLFTYFLLKFSSLFLYFLRIFYKFPLESGVSSTSKLHYSLSLTEFSPQLTAIPRKFNWIIRSFFLIFTPRTCHFFSFFLPLLE